MAYLEDILNNTITQDDVWFYLHTRGVEQHMGIRKWAAILGLDRDKLPKMETVLTQVAQDLAKYTTAELSAFRAAKAAEKEIVFEVGDEVLLMEPTTFNTNTERIHTIVKIEEDEYCVEKYYYTLDGMKPHMQVSGAYIAHVYEGWTDDIRRKSRIAATIEDVSYVNGCLLVPSSDGINWCMYGSESAVALDKLVTSEDKKRLLTLDYTKSTT